MIQFLIGVLCGFVSAIILLFIYASLVGGERDE